MILAGFPVRDIRLDDGDPAEIAVVFCFFYQLRELRIAGLRRDWVIILRHCADMKIQSFPARLQSGGYIFSSGNTAGEIRKCDGNIP